MFFNQSLSLLSIRQTHRSLPTSISPYRIFFLSTIPAHLYLYSPISVYPLLPYKLLPAANPFCRSMNIKPYESFEEETRQGKKYELTNKTLRWNGHVLHRIRALKNFGHYYENMVKAGDLGGWIESEDNLSHGRDCWVYNNAKVYGNAKVYHDAIVENTAEVYENAEVCHLAVVRDRARVHGDARLSARAEVFGDADISGNAMLDRGEICGDVSSSKYNPERKKDSEQRVHKSAIQTYDDKTMARCMEYVKAVEENTGVSFDKLDVDDCEDSDIIKTVVGADDVVYGWSVKAGDKKYHALVGCTSALLGGSGLEPSLFFSTVVSPDNGIYDRLCEFFEPTDEFDYAVKVASTIIDRLKRGDVDELYKDPALATFVRPYVQDSIMLNTSDALFIESMAKLGLTEAQMEAIMSIHEAAYGDRR